MRSAAEVVRQKAEEARKREEQLRAAVERTIPEQYRSFVVWLEERKPLPEVRPADLKGDLPPNVRVQDGRVFVVTSVPYMKVDGRVQWFADDHRKVGAKYRVTSNAAQVAEILANGQEIPKNFPLIVRVESDLYGTVEALASIQFSERGVNATNPLENAETSALGRALGKFGYGLVGTGLASAEEVEEARRREAERLEEVVEVADKPPAEVKTSEGPYMVYPLCDGRALYVPKGRQPEVKSRATVRVVGVPVPGGGKFPTGIKAESWEVLGEAV